MRDHKAQSLRMAGKASVPVFFIPDYGCVYTRSLDHDSTQKPVTPPLRNTNPIVAPAQTKHEARPSRFQSPDYLAHSGNYLTIACRTVIAPNCQRLLLARYPYPYPIFLASRARQIPKHHLANSRISRKEPDYPLLLPAAL
jgi:hypothetical protein